jgi:hypothetical protein
MGETMIVALKTAGTGFGTVEDCAKPLLRIVVNSSMNGR